MFGNSTFRGGVMRKLLTFLTFFTLNLYGTIITNGDFETGDLTGWTYQGNVEVLTPANFSPDIPVPQGNYFVLLSNGPDNSPAPDNYPFADIDNNGLSDNDVTYLHQDFIAPSSGYLCFKWAWLTGENPPYYANDIFDDIFYVLLDGTVILSGSASPGGLSPFPDIPVDNTAYFVRSEGSTDGSYFKFGRSEFREFCYYTSKGFHSLVFAVADQGNHVVDSGLLIDDVRFIPAVLSESKTLEVSNIPVFLETKVGSSISKIITVKAYSLVYITKFELLSSDGSWEIKPANKVGCKLNQPFSLLGECKLEIVFSPKKLGIEYGELRIYANTSFPIIRLKLIGKGK